MFLSNLNRQNAVGHINALANWNYILLNIHIYRIEFYIGYNSIYQPLILYYI